ncbi:MAG: hypothetical protein ACRDP4_09160, partial [Nocardioidaceae bacterium]
MTATSPTPAAPDEAAPDGAAPDGAAPEGDFVLAVDVGGTTTKAEVVDGSGHVVAARSAPTPSGAAAVEA